MALQVGNLECTEGLSGRIMEQMVVSGASASDVNTQKFCYGLSLSIVEEINENLEINTDTGKPKT